VEVKIGDSLQDFNVNLGTEKIDSIKINIKLEKYKNEEKQKNSTSMTKRQLKAIIGIFYLIIVSCIYLIFSGCGRYSLPKLVACFNWALVGITSRLLIYYQLKITEQDVALKGNEVAGTIAAYVLYAFTSFAVVSLIYVTFFETLEKKLDSQSFFWITMFLFSYVGFSILEVKKRFLGGD